MHAASSVPINETDQQAPGDTSMIDEIPSSAASSVPINETDLSDTALSYCVCGIKLMPSKRLVAEMPC